MKRTIIITLLSLLLVPLGLGAQASVDPRGDSLAMAAVRARMDSIRQKRPTVALVLCGGGAKGAAHVGVAKYLESIGMPIDMVLGTSMGGLVGALYSLGYSAADMDTVMRHIDWGLALSDKVDGSYVSYSDKRYKDKMLLSFPFYYSRRDEALRNEAAGRVQKHIHRHEDLHLGAGSGADASDLVRRNLLGSLPSGYIYGQNVNNLISSLTVGYQDSTAFVDLPIPFCCVATDMVTTKAKNWHSGKMNVAMRSTMSIPGLFSPVRVDGMVLTDGGMRNNYPADIARQMGADFVIGVELTDARKGYDDINNLGDIISQGIDMLGRESLERNIKLPDVNIKPNLKEYNMMSFDPESIEVIMRRGYEAALERSWDLKFIKYAVGEDTLSLAGPPAIDLSRRKVHVSDIRIVGVNERDLRWLMKKIRLRPGDEVGKKEIDDAVAVIFGTKAFDYVTYELSGKCDPYELVINCRKGPVHHLGVSARFDSEEVVSMLVHIGLNTHNLSGSSADFMAKVSKNPSVGISYSYDHSGFPTINLAANFNWVTNTTFRSLAGPDVRYGLDYFNARQEFYFSNIRWKSTDLRVGLRNDIFRLKNVLTNNEISGDYDLRQNDDHMSLFASYNIDNLDNAYFPNKGLSANVDYMWNFAKIPVQWQNEHIVSMGIKGVVPAGRVFAFIPSWRLRMVMGNNPSVFYANIMGGSIPGRYADQQMAFIGINKAAFMENILSVTRADFRFLLFKNNYLTAIFNHAGTFEDLRYPGDFRSIYGVGLQYAYNSILGPISATVHWSSLTNRPGLYLNLGLYF